MSKKTPSFPFPSEWNNTNERQINEYETCGIYYDDKDTFIDHYNKRIIFHIICLILLFFTIASCTILLKFRHSYEVCNKHNISMIMLYVVAIILNITTTYISQAFYMTFPCYVLSYSVIIGYPLFFFSILGFILRYIKDCYIKYSLYRDDFEDEKGNKIGLFIKKYYTDERLISILLLAVIISLVYITVLILNGGSFRLFPLEQGFCELKYEHTLNYYLITAFLIVVFPISLLVLEKLGNNFPEIKSYKISVIISFVLLSLYIVSVYIKSFKCSTILEYIPYNIAFLIMNCVFIYTQLINPIINIVKIEIQIHGLEINKKSLIKILNSNLLYDEFLDYCNSKCCGEYAIFHRDYMKFRRIYKPISNRNIENSQFIYDSNDFTNSTFSMSCVSVLTTNTQTATNFETETGEYSINIQNIENDKLEEMKRKMSTATGDNKSSILKSVLTETISTTKGVDPQEIGPDIQNAFDNVHKIINEMDLKFFKKDATLELNIPERIIKKFKKNLSNFNENYDKMKLKQSYNHEMLNCERIFDESHRECIETLYHNVLSNYISTKKNNYVITELKESKEAIDGGDENVSIKRNNI